jgi:tartrate dehydratase beta subunit/fumarate hydratase class I family protein
MQQQHGAVYFAAMGGAAALIAQSIKEVEAIAYPDLGAEAVHRMVVEDFPVIVAIDVKEIICTNRVSPSIEIGERKERNNELH